MKEGRGRPFGRPLPLFFIIGIAIGRQVALLTVRYPRRTHRPAVECQPVAEAVAFLRWQHLLQLSFHLAWILGAVGEAQPSGNADTVGVCDHHPGTLPSKSCRSIGNRKISQVRFGKSYLTNFLVLFVYSRLPELQRRLASFSG